MKTLGLMGGTDYQSTIKYLDAINTQLIEHFDENYNCKSVTYNLSKHEIKHLSKEIIYYSDVLRQAGAHILVLCEEVLHNYSKDIRRNLSIPMIHIGEAVADTLVADKIQKVLIVGRRVIMQSDYYVHAFNRKGIKVAIPSTEMMNLIQDYIDGIEKDKIKIISLIESYRIKGVSGVVFTDELNIRDTQLSMHSYNSFNIHIEAVIREVKANM